MSRFIVKDLHAAKTCWGTYRRIAVLEVEDDVKEVHMISERARGVLRVVATWERLWVGSSRRCAFEKAMEEAHEMAEDLNSPLQRLANVSTAAKTQERKEK